MRGTLLWSIISIPPGTLVAGITLNITCKTTKLQMGHLVFNLLLTLNLLNVDFLVADTTKIDTKNKKNILSEKKIGTRKIRLQKKGGGVGWGGCP